MIIEPILNRSISIDNILFSIEIMFLLGYLYISKVNIYFKIVSIVYGFITLSNYNIFIRIIHDLNIPIFRTFINKFQVFEKLNILDIFILLLFILIIPAKKTIRKIFENSKEFSYLYIATIILLSISLLSLFLNYDNNIDIRLQLTQYRGLIYAFILMFIFSILLSKINNKDEALGFIKMLITIDVINVIGELISSVIFYDFVWSRAGKNVLMIDQANSMLALCYLSALVPGSKISLIFYKVVGIIIIGIELYDFNKYLYLVIPLFIIIINYEKIKKINKFYKLIIAIISLTVFIFMLGKLIEDKSIKDTRYIQISSYLTTVGDDFYRLVLGSGFGGKYLISDISRQDHGSIKSIEREQRGNSNYQVEFQVPYLWYFKSTGLIGLLIASGMVLFFLVEGYQLRNKNIDASSFALTLAIMMIPDNPIMSPDPNSVIYFIRMFFMYYLSLKLFNNENSNKHKITT